MIRKSQATLAYFFANFNSQKDYYKILSISKNATQPEIKKAYLKYAKMYHPDTNKGKEDQFKEINEAYQVLSSEVDKKDYDEARNTSSSTTSNTSNNSNYNKQQQAHPGYQYEYRQRQQQQRWEPNPNTYRGYRKQQNWDNPQYRQKIMEDMFKVKYAQGYRHRGAQMNQAQFDQMLKERSKRNRGLGDMYDDFDEMMRRRTQKMKATRVTKQQVEQAMRMQEEKRKREFDEYKEKAKVDLQREMKERAQQMADGLKGNLDGAVRIGKYMKSLWDDVTKKKK